VRYDLGGGHWCHISKPAGTHTFRRVTHFHHTSARTERNAKKEMRKKECEKRNAKKGMRKKECEKRNAKKGMRKKEREKSKEKKGEEKKVRGK
jgi:hypothetical protein